MPRAAGCSWPLEGHIEVHRDGWVFHLQLEAIVALFKGPGPKTGRVERGTRGDLVR